MCNDLAPDMGMNFKWGLLRGHHLDGDSCHQPLGVGFHSEIVAIWGFVDSALFRWV